MQTRTSDVTGAGTQEDNAPRRTCIACRRTRPKHELLRIAATPDGVRVDPTQTAEGRGAYLCPDVTCHDIVVTRKGQPLLRALRLTSREQLDTTLAEARTLTDAPAVSGTDTTDETTRDPRGAAAGPGGQRGREHDT